MSDVLLLHAGIADRRMWEPQVEALEAAGHRVLAPDLPGFGDAPLEPGTIDYVDHRRRSPRRRRRLSSAARSAAGSRSSSRRLGPTSSSGSS